LKKKTLAHSTAEKSNEKGYLIIPEGIEVKIRTYYLKGNPYQTAIKFEDGSELYFNDDNKFEWKM
tara:strand:- start:5333 stop:5527 length:195 start_codon:yes stop_codon:yes gene_type:complete